MGAIGLKGKVLGNLDKKRCHNFKINYQRASTELIAKSQIRSLKHLLKKRDSFKIPLRKICNRLSLPASGFLIVLS
jgi:hypothetical protein